MPAGAIGGLEHRHLVAAAHQLPGATQAGNPGTGDDDPLGRTARRLQRHECGAGQLQRLTAGERERLGHVAAPLLGADTGAE
jgi:hypothetical protein